MLSFLPWLKSVVYVIGFLNEDFIVVGWYFIAELSTNVFPYNIGFPVPLVDPFDDAVLKVPAYWFLLLELVPTKPFEAPLLPMFYIAKLLLNLCIKLSISGIYLFKFPMP